MVSIISKVHPDGLCAETDLKAGMHILSVNGQVCHKAHDVIDMICRAQGEVTISAGSYHMVAVSAEHLREWHSDICVHKEVCSTVSFAFLCFSFASLLSLSN